VDQKPLDDKEPVADTASGADKEPVVDKEQFARFQKCVVEVLSVSEEQVTLDAKFGEDLDADSLDLVELVMALEEEFDITIPEEELENIATVRQAYDLAKSKFNVA
jgi:acyl carrier protein